MKIYDDVLDKQFLDYINRKVLDQNWQIHKSHPNQKTPLFFNSTVIQDLKNIRQDEFVFLLDIIISTIKNEPEIKGKSIHLERGYINLYPYGIGGDWHIDSDNTNTKTILFYPCDWKEEYGGATELQESIDDSLIGQNSKSMPIMDHSKMTLAEVEKVEYKKNRLLIFNSHIFHRATVHQNPLNRYTIAFKIFMADKKLEEVLLQRAKQAKAAELS